MDQSFAARHKMQANNLHAPRRLTTFNAQMAPIVCRDNGTRYEPRISKKAWLKHRPRLEELHGQSRKREEMREILQKECGRFGCTFRPSPAQLNRKMQMWGLSKQSKTSDTQRHSPEPADTALRHGLLPSMVPDIYPHASDDDDDDDDAQMFKPRGSPYNPTPDPIELPHLDSDTEDSSIDDYMSSPILPEDDLTRIPTTIKRYTGSALNITDIVPFKEEITYCEDQCCKTLLSIHKRLMAVSFLAGLKCWRDACGILSKVVAELDSDSNVSASDKMWVKLVNNRIKGNIFMPDRTTSIFLGEGRHNISDPLNKYIDQAESQALPSGLASLCLTTQFRRFGSFEYYVLAAENCESTDDQKQVLSAELEAFELQSSILRGILFWCNNILAHPVSRDMFEMLPQNLEHTDNLRDIALPRLLACRFVSSWVDDPPQTLSDILTSLKPRYGALFVPEVMLPEILIAISHLIVRHIKQFPMLSSPTFVDGLLYAIQNAAAKLCQFRPERYCSEIAQILISMCSQTSAIPQAGCRHSEFVAMQVAHEMMGTNGMSAQGLEHHFTWTRTADVFKVNSFYHSSSSISTLNNVTIDPANLSIADESGSAGRYTVPDALTRHDSASYVHIKNKSSSSTIEELIEDSYRTLMSNVKDCTVGMDTPFRGVRSGTPKRFPTNSTERELWNMRARAATERMRNSLIDIPIRTSSKTSSGGSRMSVATSIIAERASYYGGDEQLFVSDSGQSIMQVLNSTPEGQTMDVLDRLPDPRSHAFDTDQDPHVYRWVRAQNTPLGLGRSTSAA